MWLKFKKKNQFASGLHELPSRLSVGVLFSRDRISRKTEVANNEKYEY